mgnify:CR=1 FL=1
MEDAQYLVNLLKERALKIAVAESTTGGLISHYIVSIPGASKVFDRGVIVYTGRSYEDLLGITAEHFKGKSTVSEGIARKMAESIRQRSGMDVGLSETGMAGPMPGTEQKPAGKAYIAISTREGTECQYIEIEGDRQAIQRGIATRAILMAIAYLERTPRPACD